MKNTILKVLMENTATEGRYTGGGKEPVITVIKHSEDRARKNLLSEISDDIVSALNNNLHDEMLAELKTSHDFLLSIIRTIDDSNFDKVNAVKLLVERMQRQREIIESTTK